jgi:hypothetical protein
MAISPLKSAPWDAGWRKLDRSQNLLQLKSVFYLEAGRGLTSPALTAPERRACRSAA